VLDFDDTTLKKQYLQTIASNLVETDLKQTIESNENYADGGEQIAWT
jgi:hypothetical protein